MKKERKGKQVEELQGKERNGQEWKGIVRMERISRNGKEKKGKGRKGNEWTGWKEKERKGKKRKGMEWNGKVRDQNMEWMGDCRMEGGIGM
jgi:hypothetical protein